MKALAALALLWLLVPHAVLAHTCSAASPGTQSFGSVSPVSGSAYSVTGTIVVTCTVAPLEGLVTGTVLRVCLSLGGTVGSTRSLTGGSYSLQYNFYSDAAHTQVFGSTTGSPATPVAVDFNLGILGILLGGSASINVPIYGLIPAGQTGVGAGTYSQSFSGGSAAVNYTSYVGTAPTCSGAWTSGGSFPFTATASVINDCNLAATNVNFGSSGVLGTVLTATGSISAQCTLGDSYAIALNAGSSTGATLATRAMTLAGGGGSVSYQLYTTSGAGTVWGDGTGGTATQGSVGTGGTQTYTVYGQVPTQATPTPGNYSDTVTATVTY